MKMPKISSDFCLSLDLAKRSAEASIAPMDAAQKDWRTFLTHSIEAEPESPAAIADLLAWLASVTSRGAQCRRIVVEATSNISKRFARALAAARKNLPRVTIVNPARAKAYLISLGVRDKTDKVDAAGLALYGARCDFAAPPEPNPAQEKLCELSRLRQAAVEDRTMWKNRRGEACDAMVRKHVERAIADGDRRVEEIERDIRQVLKADATLGQQVKWLIRIQGIGFVTAVALTGELGDLSAYSRAKIVAAAGLFPKAYGSGATVRRRPRLAKGGGSHVRRALGMGAKSLLRSKSPLRAYIARLVEAGKTKACALGAAMRKLLLVARAVVVAGGNYRPEMIGREQPVAEKGDVKMT
jgi:transposase